VSGSHLNPIVSLVDAWFGACSWSRAIAYIPTQIAGCVVGTIVANTMFSRSWISWSTHHRASAPHFLSEVVATAGLIFSSSPSSETAVMSRSLPRWVCISSRPVSRFLGDLRQSAVTIARSFTNSFTGIAPSSVPLYIGGQVIGGIVGAALTGHARSSPG